MLKIKCGGKIVEIVLKVDVNTVNNTSREKKSLLSNQTGSVQAKNVTSKAVLLGFSGRADAAS